MPHVLCFALWGWIFLFLCLCARRTGPRIQAEGSDEEAAACPCLGNVVVYGERGRCLYGVAVCLRACVVLHLRFFFCLGSHRRVGRFDGAG